MLAFSSAEYPYLLLWILGGAIALGPYLSAWIKVVEWFKGKSFDASKFVTHEQLEKMKTERDAQIQASVGAIGKKIDILDRDFREQMIVIHRAIGKVEGHDEAEERASKRRR